MIPELGHFAIILALLVAIAASTSLPCSSAEPKVRPDFDLDCSKPIRTRTEEGRSTPIPYNCQINDVGEPFAGGHRPTLRTTWEVHPIPPAMRSSQNSTSGPSLRDRFLTLWTSIRLEEQNRTRR